jgi:hypothetical protein
MVLGEVKIYYTKEEVTSKKICNRLHYANPKMFLSECWRMGELKKGIFGVAHCWVSRQHSVVSHEVWLDAS